MQDFKSTLYIIFERWFTAVAELLAGLFSFHGASVSSDNLAGKLWNAGKACENISEFVNLPQLEQVIFSFQIPQKNIPDRLG